MSLYSPATYEELRWALDKALYTETGVCGVRYPRGGEKPELAKQCVPAEWQLLSAHQPEQKENLMVTYGRLTAEALGAAEKLASQGKQVSVLKLTKIFPLAQDALQEMKQYKNILFLEEGIQTGGLGQYVASKLLEDGYSGKYRLRGVNDRFVPQATVAEATALCRLDADSIAEDHGAFFAPHGE